MPVITVCPSLFGSTFSYPIDYPSMEVKNPFYLLQYGGETYCFNDLMELYEFYNAEGVGTPLEFIGYQDRANFIAFNFYIDA